MKRLRFGSLLSALLSAFALGPTACPPAQAQLIVNDPLNLIQTAMTAARTLEQIDNQVRQITNQIRSLENEALNLRHLGQTFAPDIMAKLDEMNALINEARGVALHVNETRTALNELFSGNYAGTSVARRAQIAARQIDAARGALQKTLLLQAQATEQLRQDQGTLQALAASSAGATGALSAQQAANELLAFQAEQSMRLEQLLIAQTRAEAIEQAREMEVRAAARAQHTHFFGTARQAYAGAKPWN
jgi:P-type conjugative transfer protein TrbJ